MHKLAERVELEALKQCGMLHGDIEDMMKVSTFHIVLLHCRTFTTG